MATTILIVGASGYLGNTILRTLQDREDRSNFDITLALRDEATANKFHQDGLTVKAIDLNDSASLEQAAEGSDVVFQAAASDHIGSINALIKGLQTRKSLTGKPGIYIHTSGTASLLDDAKGMYATDKVYDDSDMSDYLSIPLTAIHRIPDDMILNAKDVRTFLIAPPAMYGTVPAGAPRLRFGLPLLVRAAIALKQVGHIGEGAPNTQYSHVQDVADFHLFLMDRALAGEKVWEGPEGLYFTATETYTHKQVAEAVAKSLYKRGSISTAEVRPYTEQEIKDYLGPFADFSWASNSQSKPSKGPSLGWVPKHGASYGPGLLETIDAEIDFILEGSAV